MNSRSVPPLTRKAAQRLISFDGNRTQESSVVHTADSARFPTIPSEIQDMIFQVLLDEPQILLLEPHVCLQLDDDIEKTESGLYDTWALDLSERIDWCLSFRSNYHAPSISRVSKNTRNMMLRKSINLYTGFDIDSTIAQLDIRKVACNFELDTIYLDWEKLESNYEDDIYDTNLPVEFLENTFGDSFHKIKHLALSGMILSDEFYTDEKKRIRTFLKKFKAIQHLMIVVADYTVDLPAHERVDLVFSDELIDVKKAMKLYRKHPRKVTREVVVPHPNLEHMTLVTAADIQNEPDTDSDSEQPERYDIHPNLVIDYVIAMKKNHAELLATKKKRYFDLKKKLGLD